MRLKAARPPLAPSSRRPARLAVGAGWLVVLLAALLGFASPGHAQTPSPTPPSPTPTASLPPTPSPTVPPGTPPGFYYLDSALGVQLFKKDYPNGSPDYVQLIDLSQGARLELLHGELTELRETKGVYGGADPRLTSIPIQTYWGGVQAQEPEAFCVTNGGFFYMPEYPTRLAFPLKVDGVVVTDGWGIDTYVGQKLILQLWEDRAEIADLDQDALYGTSAPNAIGGLTEDANKRAKFSVGRTFIGLDDRDRDGVFETVLIFNTLTARQSGAAETLRSFGADKIMMLDGGGSTQLLCRSGWHIRSDRPLPSAIAVIAGVPPQVAVEVSAHSDWPVVLEGERLPVELQISNTGVLSWTPETTHFVLQTEQLEYEQRLDLAKTVPPGGTVVLQSRLIIPNRPGIVPVIIRVGVDYRGKVYQASPVRMRAVVLPFRLVQQRSELQLQVQRWAAQDPETVEKLASLWIERQQDESFGQLEPAAAPQAHPSDLVLVPLLMLPGMAIIAWALARTRH
ncbi:MAG: phosphodiester glycosidase family protein [Anaerolineales bacterium]|nr:phosphodiester glycosidase family protein [Anaerolineales bacterium]